jgi:quercetin dioxygenase-like cupin family protein
VATMRLLAGSAETNGAFAIAEFRGREGPWTVPHVHRGLIESCYILEGRFTFTIGGRTMEAGPRDYVIVPRETPHVLGAGDGGGATLVLWAPGGLEEMFIELSRLSPDALLDPATRAGIAARHDSVPVGR